jgi:hypothetical protein
LTWTVGDLGGLDHADLGEQRDLDDEREPIATERELVVAQPEERLVGARVVVRGDRGERRSSTVVEGTEGVCPVAQALARLIDDEECLDKWGKTTTLHVQLTGCEQR